MPKHAGCLKPIKFIGCEALGLDPKDSGTSSQRFEREAQTTAALRSPHTIQLYDFGVSEAGILYYVMELLDGFDVEEMVTRFYREARAAASAARTVP